MGCGVELEAAVGSGAVVELGAAATSTAAIATMVAAGLGAQGG